MISGCDLNREPHVSPTEYILHYEVSGTATRADIRYRPFGGSVTQQFNVVLPWNYEHVYYDVSSGDALYLAAQNLDSVGNLTVTIYLDGPIYKQASTADPYGFIAVYGEIP